MYFFLEGATKEGVELDVKARSLDVKMHDVGAPGKNLRFGVPQLYAAVDPAASTVVAKPSRVTVVLRKKQKGHWSDLRHKEDKVSSRACAGVLDEHSKRF